jgi:hypothetical protein
MGHAARMVMRNSYNILIRKIEGRIPLGKFRRDRIILKWNFEKCLGVWIGIIWLKIICCRLL